MICDILSTIKKYDMIKKGESIAVGFSGGADSVCLLHFLSTIKDEYDILIKAVHVNHNIRGGEAKRDENFCKDFCKRHGIEFISFGIDVPSLSKERGQSEEECGRAVRYECFKRAGTSKIAVAHTLSDSAETVIFNLARGTGLKGVSGISPVRDNIIRPLIECTREDIEHYCKEHSLQFVTDSTNLSDDYTRNKIRHGVIPVLKDINPSFEKSILRFTSNAAAEDRFLENCAEKLLEASVSGYGYLRNILLKADDAVLRRAVKQLISEKMEKDTQERHVELCVNMIKGINGAVTLSKDLYICSDGDIIFFQHGQKECEIQSWKVEFNNGVAKTPYGEYMLLFCDASEIADEDKKNSVDIDLIDTEKLCFRSRQGGDKFSDYKRNNTKTLKKLFIEKKIPSQKRNTLAVLCCENEILWLEGFGTDAKHIINKNTKKAMIVKKREDII